MQQKLKEVMIWLLFTVAFAISPLYASWILFHSDPHFQWFWLFRHGELYLVSGAFAADSISRTLRRKTPLGTLDYVIASVCVFVLFGSTMEFGMAAPKLLADVGSEPMSSNQSIRSLYYFGCMVIAGIGSIV